MGENPSIEGTLSELRGIFNLFLEETVFLSVLTVAVQT